MFNDDFIDYREHCCDSRQITPNFRCIIMALEAVDQRSCRPMEGLSTIPRSTMGDLHIPFVLWVGTVG